MYPELDGHHQATEEERLQESVATQGAAGGFDFSLKSGSEVAVAVKGTKLLIS